MFFTILLVLILIVAIYGLISSERAIRRYHRNLARAMTMIKFDTSECCKCEHREDCRVYIHATGLGNKNHESYRFE